MRLCVSVIKSASVFAMCAGILFAQSGCVRFSDKTSSASSGAASVKSMTPDALPLVNSPYPGPYRTVEIANPEVLPDHIQEFREGRFPEGKFGGSLVRSIISSDPKTFNAWTYSDTQSGQLAGLLFSGLVGVDPYTGQVIPDMAKEFHVDRDGVTYVTVLKKGLKWSDGVPVTADDVTFTWNTIIAGGYGNSSLRDVTTIGGKSPKVITVDSLTNKFVTPSPFAPFLRYLSISIAPKHIIEPMLNSPDGRQKFQHLWSATASLNNMVSLGPFKLSRYVPGQRVEFNKSDNYYVVDKQHTRLPYLDRIVYQIIPDVNTNLLKFKSNELDITAVRARDVPDMLAGQKAGNYKLYNLGQSIGTTFIMFNMNQRMDSKGNPYVDPVKSAWFNDINFRQAINHVLNRKNMVANCLRGIGFPLYTAEPPASPFFDKSLEGFPQDISYAEEQLKKSGFSKHSDGWLYDRSGHKVEFDLLAAAGGTFYEAVGNMIVDDLKKLGIKVNFQLIDFNVLADRVENSLKWQACMMSLTAGDPLEPNDAANVYRSDARLHLFDLRVPDKDGKTVVADARSWEKELDQIFTEGATTLDVPKRKEIYRRYQKIIYDQVPFVFLVSPMSVAATRNTIGNYCPTELSQSSLGLHNLEEIYKKTH
jgi:peptide/nickel transport system substrate-binding protein